MQRIFCLKTKSRTSVSLTELPIFSGKIALACRLCILKLLQKLLSVIVRVILQDIFVLYVRGNAWIFIQLIYSCSDIIYGKNISSYFGDNHLLTFHVPTSKRDERLLNAELKVLTIVDLKTKVGKYTHDCVRRVINEYILCL